MYLFIKTKKHYICNSFNYSLTNAIFSLSNKHIAKRRAIMTMFVAPRASFQTRHNNPVFGTSYTGNHNNLVVVILERPWWVSLREARSVKKEYLLFRASHEYSLGTTVSVAFTSLVFYWGTSAPCYRYQKISILLCGSLVDLPFLPLLRR